MGVVSLAETTLSANVWLDSRKIERVTDPRKGGRAGSAGNQAAAPLGRLDPAEDCICNLPPNLSVRFTLKTVLS
jgi:hypothetical protein